MYACSIQIFAITSWFLVRMYKYERRRHILGFAYPSPGLLYSTTVYIFFMLTGFLLWNFPTIGQDFRERFGYGVEYYLEGMVAGAIGLMVSYLGFSRVYFTCRRRKESHRLIRTIHNRIVSNHSSYWLAFSLAIATVVFSQFMGEFASVGYGDGNYAEKLSEPRVKLVGLVIDLMSPATALMWYLALYWRSRKLVIITLIVTLGLVFIGLGRASLFGIFGYLVPIVSIYAYRNLLPHNQQYIMPLNTTRTAIAVGAILFLALMLKSSSRMLIDFGVDRSFLDLALNYEFLLNESVFLTSLLSDAFSGFVKSVSGIDIISLIITRQANGIGLELGLTYTLIVPSIFPSLLFPDKPEITLATWYANNYWFTPTELSEYGEGVQANIFYIIGEAYLNFGRFALIALPFIMYIYGASIGYLCRWMVKPSGLYLPVFLVLTRVFHEIVMTVTTIAAVFSSVIKQILIVTVFCAAFLIFLYILNQIGFWLRMLIAPVKYRTNS